MARNTWHQPDGKGLPQDLQPEDFVEVVYEDGETDRGEARYFVWEWSQWDEDKISEYRVVEHQQA